MQLILASSSPYRAELLARLRLPFVAKAPEIDETPLHREHPKELVLRLARSKTKALADQYPNALIVGADQVAAIKLLVFGKPENLHAARRQLHQISGQRVDFITGLCLLNTDTARFQEQHVSFSVFFRPFTNTMIERYLETENPLGCAGSFRSEGLGIALVERMQGDDPSALIGLPLISLLAMLEAEGVSPFPIDVLRRD
ncbi:MAG: Maf family protein [Gammaproteobacteria bacterium]